MTRREILATMSALATPVEAAEKEVDAKAGTAGPEPVIKVDFRYSPLEWMTAYCFPDDPHKSLVDQAGRLMYGNPGRVSQNFYPTIVEFSLRGMEGDHVVRQELEAPGVPVVHTIIERPRAALELISFATNRPGEGRVDNLLMRITPFSAGKTELGRAGHAVPLVHIRTRHTLERQNNGVLVGGEAKAQLLVCSHRFGIEDYGLVMATGAARAGIAGRDPAPFPAGRTDGGVDGRRGAARRGAGVLEELASVRRRGGVGVAAALRRFSHRLRAQYPAGARGAQRAI